jgi:hypothetical protein
LFSSIAPPAVNEQLVGLGHRIFDEALHAAAPRLIFAEPKFLDSGSE